MQFGILAAIFVGGGAGALVRHYVSAAIGKGSAFPWGILVVNILGGLLMGLIVELGALKLNYSPEVRSLLTTGLLGGFTTFSAFSLDAALLIERHDWLGAALYIAGSVVLSIGALFAAMWAVRALA
jgi:CrcB protein